MHRCVLRIAILGAAATALRLAPRRVVLGVGASGAATALWPALASAEGLEARTRGMNEGNLIQSDFYFVTGRVPPRVLDLANLPRDDPKWNAWGECAKSSAGNACTYVPLQQRYTAYAKYASTVALGAQDFASVGPLLRKGDRDAVAFLLDEGTKGGGPGGAVATGPASARAATRQALLLADSLLISANSGGLGQEILVARFYLNEAHYATEEVVKAFLEGDDTARALDAWALGVDSYNSYFTIVNKAIVPKVGEPFPRLGAA